MIRTLAIAAFSLSGFAAHGQTCDRACLKTALDQYLAALVTHEPSAAPLALGFRQTENAEVRLLGNGLWQSMMGLGEVQRRYLDAVTEQAGYFGTIEEAAGPAIVTLRLKVEARRITEAEWEVMQVFWERGSLNLREAVEGLGEGSDWKPRTVQTLIRRLVTKGALSVAEENGREFRYEPAFSQAECQHDESRTFLGRVFDGRLVPFLAGMVEKEAISSDEIDELRRLLDEAEKRQNDPE